MDSETTDTISADLVTNLLNRATRAKAMYLTEFEANIFYFYQRIIPGARKAKPISTFLRWIVRLQMFTVMCFLDMMRGFEGVRVSMELDQFLWFVANFWYGSEDIIPDPVYFAVIGTIVLLCFSAFCYGIFLSRHRRHIGIWWQTIFAIFIIDIPGVVIVPLVNQSSRLLSLMMRGSLSSGVMAAELGMSIVACALLLLLRFFAEGTVNSSLFYDDGRWIEYFRSITVEQIMLTYLALMNITWGVLDVHHFVILSCVFSFLIGVYLTTLGFLQNRFCGWENGYKAAQGLTFILIAALSLLEEFSLFKDVTWATFVYALVFIDGTLLLNMVLHVINKGLIRDLRSGVISFEAGEGIGHFKLVHLVKLGMEEALDCIMDLLFVDAALAATRPAWTQYQILQFVAIINPRHEKARQIMSMVVTMPESAIADRYILYEYDVLDKASVTGDVPDDVKELTTELGEKIERFQTAVTAFTTRINEDSRVNYLLVDALGAMKEILGDAMMYLVVLLPNCPNVLFLYSEFMNKVTADEDEAKLWSAAAGGIRGGSLVFADYAHLHALNPFPKLQNRVLMDTVHGGVAEGRKFHDFGFSSGKSRQFVGNKSRQDSGRSLSVIFERRMKMAMNVVWMFFIFFVIWTFIHLMTQYTRRTSNRAEYARVIEGAVNWLNMTGTTSIFLMRTLHIMGNRTVDTDLRTYREDLARSWGSRVGDSRVHTLESVYENVYESNGFEKVIIPVLDMPVILVSSDIDGQEVSIEMLLYIERLHYLFTVVYDENTHADDYSDEILDFSQAAYSAASNFDAFWIKLEDSIAVYTDELSDSWQVTWTVVVVACIWACLGVGLLFLYKEFERVLGVFPRDKSEKNRMILGTFLSKDFWTLFGLLVTFFVLTTLGMLSCFGVGFALTIAGQGEGEFIIEQMAALASDAHHFTSLCGPFVEILLFLNEVDIKNRSIDVIESISAMLETFVGDTVSIGLTSGRRSVNDYRFMEPVIECIATGSLDKLKNSDENVYGMIAIASDEICNEIWANANWTIIDTSENMSIFMVVCSFIIRVFLWINIIFVFVCALVLLRITRNSEIVTRLVALIPDGQISSPNQIYKMLQKGGRATSVSGVERTSVLDMVPKPCAVADQNGFIVTANRGWLEFYDEGPEYVIGRTVEDFLHMQEVQHHEVILDDGSRLVVVNDMKGERESEHAVASVQKKLRSLWSLIIPRMYVEYANGADGDVELGFLVNCTIMMSPTRPDGLNPDEWIADVQQFENWIMERCEACEDTDVLRGSPREVVILFGVDGRYEPDLLLEMSVFIICDILRWGFEWKWSGGGFDLGIAMTSGEGTILRFDRARPSRMEMYGPLFDRQVLLRERVDIGALVCCAQTYAYLQELKVGARFDPVDEESYMFSIGEEIEMEYSDGEAQEDVFWSQSSHHSFSCDLDAMSMN